MALRKRGGKPEPEEEEDLEEGADEAEGEEEGEEAAEEEGGEEEAEGEEAGEEAAADEEAGEDEEEDEEEEEEDEEVSSKSRRGPAAKGTIKDTPVMDGYTWMTVLTCCLFIVAIIVQVRDHSVHWRMGMAMNSDPVRSTTHFNATSELNSEAAAVGKFGAPIDPSKDRFGQDVMEYQEVTAADAADYAKLRNRVLESGRGDRPIPNLGDTPPETVTPLAPLYGVSAVEWTNANKEMAGGSSDTPPVAPPPATPPSTTTPPADGATTPAPTTPTTPATPTTPTP